MTSKRWLFVALLLLAALRLVFVSTIELAPDESYYYQWSLHPDICYFSKGPGVAAAIWLGTHLLGPTETGVRLMAPLLSLGTSLLMFLLARRLYSESVALWTVIAINMMPIQHVGSVVMTIDPPSIFFWAAGLYTFWRALESSEPAAIASENVASQAIRETLSWNPWWPATGLMLGLGFLCKWTNLMQLVSILLLLGSTQKLRPQLRKLGFWSMLLIFGVFLLPPLLWNAEHQWITLAHLTQRGGLNEPFRIHPAEPFAFLGAHAGVYSPLLFVAMFVSAWRAVHLRNSDLKSRFLLAFTLPLFGLYFLLSFKKAGEPNWTGPAFISAAILAAADWLPRAEQSLKIRRFLGAGLAFGLLLSVLILNVDILREAGFPLPAKLDPSKRLRGWHTMADAAEQTRSDLEKSLDTSLFLIANRREVASGIGFYLQNKRLEASDHPPVYTPESQVIEDQYSLWPRYDTIVPYAPGQKPTDALYTEENGFNPFVGRNALFLSDTDESVAPPAITGAFQKTELVKSFDIIRYNRTFRTLHIYLCTNYHGRSL